MSLLRKIFKLGPPAQRKPELSSSVHEIVVPQMDAKQFVIAAIREDWDAVRKLADAPPGSVTTLTRTFYLHIDSDQARALLNEALVEAVDEAKDEKP